MAQLMNFRLRTIQYPYQKQTQGAFVKKLCTLTVISNFLSIELKIIFSLLSLPTKETLEIFLRSYSVHIRLKY